MSNLPETLVQKLTEILGAENLVRTGESLETLSKDFYWYSPVLKPELDEKRADAIARVGSLDELGAVLSACAKARVPVTPRGAGTGNYGQCVPIFGGVVVDLARFDRILEITTDGVLRAEPGARIGTIEPEARKRGWEMRCIPSTWVKSSIGGFFCGGSGGIGSITWGGIASPGNVKSVTLMTCEETPRLIRFEEGDSTNALRTFGTTGIMVEIEMRLAPKCAYEQMILSSSSWSDLLAWTDKAARNPGWHKRLVTQFQWPIPSYFKPLAKHFRNGEHATFLLVDPNKANEIIADAAAAGISCVWRSLMSDPPKSPLLTDYTWNHTTLWAMKSDPQFTYLQAGFPGDFAATFENLQARFPGELLFHLEWMSGGTQPCPSSPAGVTGSPVNVGGIPLVRYTTTERLNEIIAYCRSIGVGIGNPHTYKLEEAGALNPDMSLKHILKAETDPQGLMNPGKMASFPVNPFAAVASEPALK